MADETVPSSSGLPGSGGVAGPGPPLATPLGCVFPAAPSETSPFCVYVLRKRDIFVGSYEYVGETDDLPRRLAQHIEGRCETTRQLFAGARFDLVLELTARCASRADAKRLENTRFLERADALGVDRVYGAAHTRIPRPAEERRNIASILDSIHGRCYLCHLPGHYGGPFCSGASGASGAHEATLEAASAALPKATRGRSAAAATAAAATTAAAALLRPPVSPHAFAQRQESLREAARIGHGRPLIFEGTPFAVAPVDPRLRDNFLLFLQQRAASTPRRPRIYYGERCRLVNYWVSMRPDDPRFLALPAEMRTLIEAAACNPIEDPYTRGEPWLSCIANTAAPVRNVRRRVADDADAADAADLGPIPGETTTAADLGTLPASSSSSSSSSPAAAEAAAAEAVEN